MARDRPWSQGERAGVGADGATSSPSRSAVSSGTCPLTRWRARFLFFGRPWRGGRRPKIRCPDMNTNFSCTRPDSPAPRPVDPPLDERSHPRGAAPVARILLADRDPDVRRVLGEALQFFRFHVDVVGDGERAWTALCSHSYDLVVTDYMMPMLNGVDLLRRLRAVRVDLPCILFSGDLPSMDVDLLALVHPGRALEKPIHLEVLVAMVRSLVAEHPVAAVASSSRTVICQE